ncbi:MAG: VirB8/TrbF family protein [Acidobacteria bacterium]|nr:VirB8/TrbF family protein [Acidobacteriota bacterium]
MSKPNPGKEFADVWGELVVSNRHFRLATYVLGAVLLLLLIAVVRLSSVELPKPIVIRVDEVGRAEALAYDALEAQADPLDPTTKYFLASFVSDHFSRRTATAQTAWARSLRFLATGLADAAFRRDGQAVAGVAAGLAEQERQVERVALSIRPQPDPPHSAAADFELVILEDGEEVSRERWSVSLQFTFLPEVPPDLLPVNPMGILVTYIQADQVVDF